MWNAGDDAKQTNKQTNKGAACREKMSSKSALEECNKAALWFNTQASHHSGRLSALLANASSINERKHNVVRCNASHVGPVG